MSEQELKQENEKLQARLKKAVEVFGEQKATIQRLTEERDAAVAKTTAAQEQDEQFFAQVQEIETLKSDIETLDTNIENLQNVLAEKEEELTKANERIVKATEAFKKQKEEIDGLKVDLQASEEELASTREFIGTIKTQLTDFLK